MKQTIPMWDVTEDKRTLRIVFRQYVTDKEVEKLQHKIRGIDDMLSTLNLLFECEKNSPDPNHSILGLLEKTIALYDEK